MHIAEALSDRLGSNWFFVRRSFLMVLLVGICTLVFGVQLLYAEIGTDLPVQVRTNVGHSARLIQAISLTPGQGGAIDQQAWSWLTRRMHYMRGDFIPCSAAWRQPGRSRRAGSSRRCRWSGAAGRTFGLQIHILNAGTERDFDFRLAPHPRAPNIVWAMEKHHDRTYAPHRANRCGRGDGRDCFRWDFHSLDRVGCHVYGEFRRTKMD
jgi:hypothetical protein